MKKIIKLIVVIIMFSIISIDNVFAKEFPITYTDISFKPWNIYLSKQVDKHSVSNDTVYILNSDTNEKIKTNLMLSRDEMSLTIHPNQFYAENIRYTLIIENLKSKDGQFLNEKTTMDFIYTTNESE